ncbi:MAG: phenylalanine--tRNA ligase subunit alpha [Clostridia bacterium]|nr:phenylalanine--tRNA ligase subunit alpha [Clostridia bacterium]
MKNKLEEILKSGTSEIEVLQDLKTLDEVRVKYLGKAGALTQILRGMKDVPAEERREVGSLANSVRETLEKALSEKWAELENAALVAEMEKEKIDITEPSRGVKRGALHPLTRFNNKFMEICVEMGFTVIQGPEIETDYYNFEALNVPKNHPARDMQDSFYITDNILMRTQTSNMQIRAMEKMKPPFKVVCPGRVNRNDSDSSHSPIFNQFEALVIDENIGLKDLMMMIKEILKRLFGEDVKMRVRPSYFPFTEPSIEIDATCQRCQGKGCSLCKGTGFSEVFGAGVVNPKVLEMSGIDSVKYSGFAFGPGIDRSVMVTNKIPNIKYLFRNDLRFLKQMR